MKFELIGLFVSAIALIVGAIMIFGVTYEEIEIPDETSVGIANILSTSATFLVAIPIVIIVLMIVVGLIVVLKRRRLCV